MVTPRGMLIAGCSQLLMMSWAGAGGERLAQRTRGAESHDCGSEDHGGEGEGDEELMHHVGSIGELGPGLEADGVIWAEDFVWLLGDGGMTYLLHGVWLRRSAIQFAI
jgi:hypothetical protein